MTLKELEDGIHWHYEKGIRLRNSTIFEQPEEEWEGHPDVLGQASRSCLFKKPKVYKAGNRGHSQQGMLFVFYPEENAGRLFAAGNHPDNRI